MSKIMNDYRDYLRRYAEISKQRRPQFSLGAWAKSLGLKSTSSLTKVLNGEREPGPELISKLVEYFKFSRLEEAQFRNLVALSKLKESSQQKAMLAQTLLRSQNSKNLQARMLELDHFELLASYLPMAIRELTRLPQMKSKKLAKLLPEHTEEEIQEATHLLSKLDLVKRDEAGNFVATDEQVRTEPEIESEGLKSYHQSSLQLAADRLKECPVEEREFQSLILLLNSNALPSIKKKVRDFLDSLECEIQNETEDEEIDQLYQIQLQMIPVSKKFEKTKVKLKKGEK